GSGPGPACRSARPAPPALISARVSGQRGSVVVLAVLLDALGVLPVPPLVRAGAAGTGPRRVLPAEGAGVLVEPGPRRPGGGAAAQVDGQAPAVVALAGLGGQAALGRLEHALLADGPVTGAEAQVGAE